MTGSGPRFLAAILLVGLTLNLAACGKKGRLEAPPGADPAKSDVKLPTKR